MTQKGETVLLVGFTDPMMAMHVALCEAGWLWTISLFAMFRQPSDTMRKADALKLLMAHSMFVVGYDSDGRETERHEREKS